MFAEFSAISWKYKQWGDMDLAQKVPDPGQTSVFSMFTWQISTHAYTKKAYQIQASYTESDLSSLSSSVVRETTRNLSEYHC